MSLTLTAMSDSKVTSGQQQWSGSGQTPRPARGPYISVITNRLALSLLHIKSASRGFVLRVSAGHMLHYIGYKIWGLSWLLLFLPCRTTNLLIRGAMLFSVGVFLALVLNLLQVQRNVTLFPPDVISSIFSSAWWVPPCCGTASGTWRFLAVFRTKCSSYSLSVELKNTWKMCTFQPI